MNDVVVAQDVGAVMAVIERAASNKDVDISKLEKLLDMQERIMAKNAEMAFNSDMALMQSELPTITELGEIKVNGVVRSKYARFEDMNEAVKPVLQKYGFAVNFKTDTANAIVKVIGILTHRLGHRETTDMVLPVDVSGSKNPVQAIGSSVSYGKRYVMEALLNITSRGLDNDGGDPKPEPDAAGKKAIEACGSMDALRKAWNGLTAAQRATLGNVKEDCKKRIQGADRATANA